MGWNKNKRWDGLVARRSAIAGSLTVIVAAMTASAFGQQFTNHPLVQVNFTGIGQIGSGIGNITQMAFGPDGRLYVSTFTNGIKRYDYDPNGNLSGETTVWSRAPDPETNQMNGSLGIAFHEDPLLGSVMYIAPAVTSSFNPHINIIQSIVRLTDDNGNGVWGEMGEVNQAIVDNLRVTDLHQVNQMQVRDDALYVSIGSRTRTGGERSEYPGDDHPDDGEFAYTGAINWIRDLTQLSGDTTTSNLAGFQITEHHTDTQTFTSTDTGKLTVYSTGLRNPYGIAFDTSGQLWLTMNENENPLKPDTLHRSDFQDDHGFPKANAASGDWKQNPDAIAAGFFQTFKDPVALLGNHAAANGLDFTDRNGAFAGHPFLVRWNVGKDLLAVDPDTGDLLQVATGFANPIDVLTDPFGNLLVGDFGAGGRIFRLELVERPDAIFGDLNGDGEIDAVDWAIVRDNFNQDFTGMTIAEAYALGDLNADLRNDILDVALFKQAYEDFHGAGSFADLNVLVPEPNTWTMLFFALGGLLASARRVAPPLWARRAAALARHDLATQHISIRVYR